MKYYFAYGSNMSLSRLQERTGVVVSHGRALLEDHVHSFSHRGQDGTAKGNIERRRAGLVVGVLYQLRAEQSALLAPYEGGYEVIEVAVRLASSDSHISAYTYLCEDIVSGLLPLSSYVEHYLQGMQENGFPPHYIEQIRKQAAP